MNNWYKSIEQRARRAAKRIGLKAEKSRRALSIYNHGGFQIIDPYFNTIQAGEKYDMTAEEVIEFCK